MTISQQTARVDKVRVWDVGVRLFHWTLVTSVIAAYFLAENRGLHRRLGYVVIALICLRLVWGLVGSHHAKFVNFVPGPGKFFRYINDMRQGREARYLGHNPAGAAMIVALLGMLVAVGATGYMMGTQAYFGIEWVEDAHEMLVNGLIVLIVLHVCGVVVSSRRHRENLVLAMITGDKDIEGHENE